MVTVGLLATLEAKPGKEGELAALPGISRSKARIERMPRPQSAQSSAWRSRRLRARRPRSPST